MPEATDKPKSEKQTEKEPTITVERLIAEATTIGLTPADVAGAFDGVDRDKEYTVQAAKSRVEKWLSTEVKTSEA